MCCECTDRVMEMQQDIINALSKCEWQEERINYTTYCVVKVPKKLWGEVLTEAAKE